MKKLSSNTVKLIAILAMTLDHVAWLIFPGYSRDPLAIALHIIGRITCPVMCYFIAEGYHYTKSVSKYTGRLFFFAFLSHFPYLYGMGHIASWQDLIPFRGGMVLNQTSVMWALAWGLVMLRIVNSRKINSDIAKTLSVLLICLVSFPADWSCTAGLCILAMGTNRGNFKVQMGWMVFYVAIYSGVYFFALDKVYGLIQMAVVLAIPVLGMYNGTRGTNQTANKIMKWAFYLYYPLHLLIIGVLRAAG